MSLIKARFSRAAFKPEMPTSCRDAVSVYILTRLIQTLSPTFAADMLTPPYDSMMEMKGFRRLVLSATFSITRKAAWPRPTKRSKKNPIQVQRVVRTMVRSMIRIRQNPDERLSYIAGRWKRNAASSYDTMLKAFTVAAILSVFARRKSKSRLLNCCAA